MGRKPCCSKEEVNRGAWSFQEDQILINYINTNGQGKWRALPKKSGLNRCGKSCRLRWLNYLRPDIKRGQISKDEEDLIIRLHRLLGNRWSLIAGRLPGRTDNEIKNYWNTNLGKRVCHEKPASSSTPKGSKAPENMHMLGNNPHLIRTRAVRCSTLKFPLISQVQGSYDDVTNASPALNDDCSIRAMHTQDPKAHNSDNGQCSSNNLNTNTAAMPTLEEDDDSLGFLADLDMENIGDIFDDPMNTLSSYVDDHLLSFNDPFNSIPAASLPHPGNAIVTSNDDDHGHGLKCDTHLEMNLMLELKKVAAFLDLEDI